MHKKMETRINRAVQLMAWTLLLGLFAGLTYAGEADSVLELDVVGTIEVAADGSVHDYTLETGLKPSVKDLVGRTVRSWRFEPILVDGKPVIATTRMLLQLEALLRNDTYVLRVADVNFGTSAADKANKAPRYPLRASGSGVGAKVLLLLKLDATGKVAQVHVEQVSLSKQLNELRQGWLVKQFAKVSREAAADWRYHVSEIVDGEPIGIVMRVPIEFSVSGHGDWIARQSYIPGPYHPSPWGDAGHVAQVELDALEQGDLQSVNSRFKLTSEVVGSIL